MHTCTILKPTYKGDLPCHGMEASLKYDILSTNETKDMERNEIRGKALMMML